MESMSSSRRSTSESRSEVSSKIPIAVAKYYKAAPATHSPTLLEMRKRILKVVPNCSEVMSYAMPAFKVNGTIVADESPSPAAIAELVDVLLFVRGLPFSGRSYAWADAEGITSTVVWLVTRAIELAVEVAKSHGDAATVLDATAAGLRMLPNDEYFLGLQRSAMGSRFIDDGGVAPSPSQSPVASTR